MTAPPLQIVDKDGIFNRSGLEELVQECGLAAAGTTYQIVSIMGPQSSGKSTLLNNLFGTGFRMMNAETGRSQTTQGIWMSRSSKMDNCTLVLDLEGSDGRERGEDDTSFERQSALFAMAVSDVLMINIWHHDIGREQGAGKPLMRTVLQVHLKLLTEESKRTVLVFVIRDKAKKTPLSSLENILMEDLLRIWNSVPKSPEISDRPLEDFFEVKFLALPSYEEREEEFKAEVVVMRQQFDPESEHCIVKPESKLPGSVFTMSAERMWEVVHSHKDLNLPAHKVMVANIRCKEIMSEKLEQLQEDQAWHSLGKEAREQLVPDMGATLAGLMSSCVSGYDEEAQYFDLSVMGEKRKDLLDALHGLGADLVAAQYDKLRAAAMEGLNGRLSAALSSSEDFTKASGEALKQAGERLSSGGREIRVVLEGSNLFEAEELAAASKIKTELRAAVDKTRSEKVEAVVSAAGKKAKAAVAQVSSGLLEDMPADLWPSLRGAVEAERAAALKAVQSQLKGFSLREEETDKALSGIAAELRGEVERRTRESCDRAIHVLKDSFNRAFNYDASGIPRIWGTRDNIPRITGEARTRASTCLSQLAVLRLDEGVERKAADVEAMIAEALLEADNRAADASGSYKNPLAVAAWPNVPEASVLLQPPRCRSVWRQFRTETDFVVSNARNTQLAHQNASSKMPPLWAIIAIAFLGFDEFVGVLYSPMYLILGIALFLFGRQMYLELDVDAEMQKGALPGIISLSAKAGPVFRRVSMTTAEAVSKLVTGEDGLVARAAAGAAQHMHQHRPASAPAGSEVEMSAVGSGRNEPSADGLRHRSTAAPSSSSSAARPASAPAPDGAGTKHE